MPPTVNISMAWNRLHSPPPPLQQYDLYMLQEYSIHECMAWPPFSSATTWLSWVPLWGFYASYMENWRWKGMGSGGLAYESNSNRFANHHWPWVKCWIIAFLWKCNGCLGKVPDLCFNTGSAFLALSFSIGVLKKLGTALKAALSAQDGGLMCHEPSANRRAIRCLLSP